ncbi:4-formylbenzenesulfonate dehydrogenase TsaC1/TsaC2 [Roseivivax jejudonensis]|uniref:4-formylbenzenesulfonate dehydrogenase TsaC1/TsaC2 n=1 Tax=Roseivivax jejudonensis TaxID=1529041 RepID=A0A1X6ZIG8_9RHOB|nr:glucose 1-dehydrogenase [Roseivivax jejudonensis]SLN52084.1 4-formylbenzenesulfonate dehydrogenase TsaC1/TsaC2 [Roseivivax jejudonensis]
MRLKGKRAVVTGAASGFGAGIAQRFAEEGAQVMVADIAVGAAETWARRIGGIAHEVDVADGDSVDAMAETALRDMGGIDILVNNAGVTHLPTALEDVEEEEFDHVFAVNCKSVYLTARALVPAMKSAGAGTIVNVASSAALSPRPRLNWYNASKGWMVTATKTMAVELAPFGIRVNALAPVAGDTPLLKRFLGEDTPERREQFLATIPLGRFSAPEDLAAAALYLASDEAAMVTGTVLEVDGGRCI